jgi:LCP family protein required for cell wall assembly
MAREEKPYRVYRGGRAKGRVPLQSRPERVAREGGDGKADGRPKRPRRQTTWTKKTWIGIAILLLFVLLLVWAVASWFAFKGGAEAANRRLKPRDRAALAQQSGLLLSHPTNILLLGTDHANTDARVTDQHSDSIMLVRADPKHHRLAYLTIPRDLYVAVPGHGDDKINSAFQIGGAALATRTVQGFTGVPVNHVVIVDFGDFRDLIDAVGGVTIDVPKTLISDKFDCPYPTQARCDRWGGWHFEKGRQHLDGRRALIYSRIRVAQNSNENDITRGERQQVVLQALMGRLTSPGTMLKLPWIGGKLMKPLTTDLSAGQLLQLGWVKFRASSSRDLHCRLGGSAEYSGGASIIRSSEENISTIHMFMGDSAPQPPPPGSGPFGPGCVIGNRSLGG